MRTTLIIDEGLSERARALTGIQEKTSLVRAGLEALIAREAAKRLATLGGAQPKIATVPGGEPPDGARRHFRLDSALPARRAAQDHKRREKIGWQAETPALQCLAQ